MDHSAHHHPDPSDVEWAADLEREAGVMVPYVRETASWVSDLCRRDGIAVRRILDVGSGPGVVACELAGCFPTAVVVAVDESPTMLERSEARAEAAGLSGRITTHRADLREGLGRPALLGVDLVWMAMVLHHVGNEVAVLRDLREVLNPGGLLVLVEHAEPLHFLGNNGASGSPGLIERMEAARAAWIASMSADYPALLNAAGFEIVADRVARVREATPLGDSARQVVYRTVRGLRGLGSEQLDEEDLAAIDVLLDPEHPRGIMRRPDVFFDASRHVYVAKSAGAS